MSNSFKTVLFIFGVLALVACDSSPQTIHDESTPEESQANRICGGGLFTNCDPEPTPTEPTEPSDTADVSLTISQANSSLRSEGHDVRNGMREFVLGVTATTSTNLIADEISVETVVSGFRCSSAILDDDTTSKTKTNTGSVTVEYITVCFAGQNTNYVEAHVSATHTVTHDGVTVTSSSQDQLVLREIL